MQSSLEKKLDTLAKRMLSIMCLVTALPKISARETGKSFGMLMCDFNLLKTIKNLLFSFCLLILKSNGGQFLMGKSMDTFCPLGPCIVHKSQVPDPHNLKVNCSINGIEKQSGNTNELIFKIDDIIHLLSK